MYKRLIVNGEIIAGENVLTVRPPDSNNVTWRIILKNGTYIEATGQVSIYLKPDAKGEN